MLKIKSLEEIFAAPTTRPSPASSTSVSSPSNPAKSVKKASTTCSENAKKRKRVIDEDDDDCEPDAVLEDDYDILDADSEDFDDHRMITDGMELSDDDISAKESAKPVTKKRKLSSQLDVLESDFSAHSEPVLSSSRPVVPKSLDGSRIEEKLEAAQSKQDSARHELYSERVVASVERARDRMLKYATENVGGDGEEGDDEELDDEEEEKKPAKAAKGAKRSGKPSGPKYTPLELQYLEIRKDYPDAVLFVESGYRYRFFGKDAEIAAKVLNIRAGVSHNFLATSVPVHRLHVHAMRLVQAGYKVGVVSQTETAALKAISSNRSGPFKRAVSALYTKSTLVNESMDPLASDSGSYGQYLMAIFERPNSSTSTLNVDATHFDLVAVKTSTGDIVYDSFDDGFMRTELETRLRHINPIEIVLPEDVSTQTRKLIENLTSSRTKEDSVRVEYLKRNCFDLKHAKELIADELSLFAYSLASPDSEQQETKPSHSKIVNYRELGKQMQSKAATFYASISDGLTIAFGALAHYLKEFGISSLLCLSCNFNAFSSAKHMQLDGNALWNLEILFNQHTNAKEGSLLAIIDRTSTAFGRRRLMQWMRQPLMQKVEIEARLDAVEELARLASSDDADATSTSASTSSGPYVPNVARKGLKHLIALLPQLPDLERGICRIFYNRCSVSEFISVLVAFRHIEQRMPKHDEIEHCCTSTLLKTLLKAIPHDLSDHVSYFMDPLNVASTDKQKRDLFLNDSIFPALHEVKEQLKACEDELADHLVEIRKKIGKPRLEYVTKNKDEYVIELTKAEGDRVPRSWIPLPSPQSASRFHTQFIIDKYQELLQYRERLAIETSNAWASFVSDFASRYTIFRNTVDVLSSLDALNSFALLSKTDGYVRPQITDPEEDMKKDVESGSGSTRGSSPDDYAQITVRNGRHPIIESILQKTATPFVPNDTELGAAAHDQKCIIITGPNMGGKTCYTRQVAILCIMAQMGCFVPAEEMILSPIDLIATRMGAYDNMAKGQSTFFVELQETSDIMKNATSRSLVILDELGRGTSTHDGFSIAYATLHYLLKNIKCFTLFVTHYPALSQLTRLFPNLVNNHHISYLEEAGDLVESENEQRTHANVDMDVTESSGGGGGGGGLQGIGNVVTHGPRITFLHKLVIGVEGRSFGMNVARLANLPTGVVTRAAEKSNALEKQVKAKYAKIGFKQLYELCKQQSATPCTTNEEAEPIRRIANDIKHLIASAK